MGLKTKSGCGEKGTTLAVVDIHPYHSVIKAKFGGIQKSSFTLADLLPSHPNITGGPSTIFHRHHEKSHTLILSNISKPVQIKEGFDANALHH